MSAEYLIETNNANIVLEASIVNDDLQLYYDGKDLSQYAGLHVGRDPGETIAFRVDDFGDAGLTWVVNATPKLTVPRIPWDRNGSSATDAVEQTVSDAIEVRVEATEPSTSQTKVKHIYIKTTPKQGLPDPRMNNGG